MSKDTAGSDESVLAALESIVRMQTTIRGGMDVCVDMGLTFLRVYYDRLPPSVARRLTELRPDALAAIPKATSPQGSPEERQGVAELVASDAAFAQAIRAANAYRAKLGYGPLGPDGLPTDQGPSPLVV